MSTIKEIQAYLSKYHIKPSMQRIAIMDYMLSHRIHPCIEEIYDALSPEYPTLSKTTVYNTLKLFVEQKAVTPIVIDEKNIRFDIHTMPHAHFMCMGCGKVYDLSAEEMQKLSFKEEEEYVVTEIHLYYKGFCKNCIERKNK
ncbi:transcriptional repressor [uncultured Sanguibacteroides sp.]|uniref:Fur family transcriptional regulator n=1 Tax=uncultured Sanguibacteroides sp. TaxID=1635151 RepID=UPI0025FE9762|nr:transcriptional repressor [uncultured Sanguibacteroides sp.]